MTDAPDPRTFHILLVDDNAADVYLFREALQRAGLTFELMVIKDGGDALAFARSDSNRRLTGVPDLLLDLNLRHDRRALSEMPEARARLLIHSRKRPAAFPQSHLLPPPSPNAKRVTFDIHDKSLPRETEVLHGSRRASDLPPLSSDRDRHHAHCFSAVVPVLRQNQNLVYECQELRAHDGRIWIRQTDIQSYKNSLRLG